MHASRSLLERHGLGAADMTGAEKKAVEIDIKYAGFISRQEKQLEQLAAKSFERLPDDIGYYAIATLSMEAREKLSKVDSCDRC